MAADLPIVGLTLADACRIAGVGQTTMKSEIRNPDNEIETFTIGCRRLIVYETLKRYLDRRRANPGDPRRNLAVAKAGERRKAGVAS
jgi:hypothetical protein